MIPVVVILVYLVVIAVIGGVAFKRSKENTEDFFLANRSIGSMVFFLSIFATNMTAFAILGSSGQAYRQGIGIYGLMASSSCFVIPLTIFFIGTRLWAMGKKFGHQTQVSFFRDRWECNHIGTVIFALSAAMLVPYMIISIMGGGTVLADISDFAGDASTADSLRLGLRHRGRGRDAQRLPRRDARHGLGEYSANDPVPLFRRGGGGGHQPRAAPWLRRLHAEIWPRTTKRRFLVTRERMPPQVFWSYTLIPLSSIMFPHMAIMCFSARRVSAFKQTVVALSHRHPGHLAAVRVSRRAGLRRAGQNSRSRRRSAAHVANLRAGLAGGILGAGIISAVMGSDAHQVLALSTMFTKDVFAHYGGHEKFGETPLRSFCARLYRGGHDHRLFGRAGAEGKAGHFRDRGALRVFRFRGDGAGDGGGAVLEAQHQMGRVGRDPFCRGQFDWNGVPPRQTGASARASFTRRQAIDEYGGRCRIDHQRRAKDRRDQRTGRGEAETGHHLANRPRHQRYPNSLPRTRPAMSGSSTVI